MDLLLDPQTWIAFATLTARRIGLALVADGVALFPDAPPAVEQAPRSAS